MRWGIDVIHSFRQSDVTRAMRGAQKAGGVVVRVEIEPGKIVVICSDDKPHAQPDSPVDFEARLREKRGWAG